MYLRTVCWAQHLIRLHSLACPGFSPRTEVLLFQFLIQQCQAWLHKEELCHLEVRLTSRPEKSKAWHVEWKLNLREVDACHARTSFPPPEIMTRNP